MKNTFSRKFMVCALAGVLGFALSACDDSSSAGGDETETSALSSAEGQEDVSSSSEKSSSSSSVKDTEPAEVSSSSTKENKKSSDSESSSSVKSGDSSSNSSAGKVNCSALLEGEMGWSWDVPKECRFNPDIDYGSMTDERDGKVYRTMEIRPVGIGPIHHQVWMAENLNYADSVKTPSLLERSWCYNDEPANCDVGGRLYTWAAAIDSVKLATDADNPQVCGYGKTCTLSGKVQGICPNGWHLPTYDEWMTLFKFSCGVTNASKELRSQTGWYDNGNGWDTDGFSALPAGSRDDNGDFNGAGEAALFWNATQAKEYYSYGAKLFYRHDGAGSGYIDKSYALSIRCLMDSE